MIEMDGIKCVVPIPSRFINFGLSPLSDRMVFLIFNIQSNIFEYPQFLIVLIPI